MEHVLTVAMIPTEGKLLIQNHFIDDLSALLNCEDLLLGKSSVDDDTDLVDASPMAVYGAASVIGKNIEL